MSSGCAERGAPPGGPIDDVDPVVIASEPPAGAVAVAGGDTIRITFSERMNQESVERALRITPQPGRFDRAWEGTALTATLPADAARGPAGERIVTLLRSAEDRRGNKLPSAFDLAYTSGDALPAGEIAGKLTGDAQGQARVLLFASPGPPLDSLLARPALRETSAAQSGEFRLRFLPTASASPFALFAVLQARPRDRLDPARDRVAVGPDSLLLSPEHPKMDGADLALVRPDAPGSLLGRVAPPRPGVTVRLVSLADSTRSIEATPDSIGAFLLESIPPGLYRLRLQEGGEDSPVIEEPLAGVPEPLVIAPGRRVALWRPDSASAPTSPPDSSAMPVRPEEEQ